MIEVDSEVLSDVISSIYHAAYDQRAWGAAVAKLENLFGASKACFARFGPDIGENDSVTSRADPTFQRRYIEEHAHEPNIFADAVIAAPARTVYSDHQIVGFDRLRRTRFWNEWMAPQDMYGGIGCKLLISGPSFWFFDVQRGRNQKAFEARDAALLQTLVPHLVRATELGQQFQNREIIASTFSHLPFGVIVVDGQMRVSTMNTAAEAILRRQGGPLVSKAGMLSAGGAEMTTLRNMVEQACSIRNDVMPGTGGDLLIRSKAGPDLALSVGPLVTASRGAIPLVAGQAAIFIREISLDVPVGFENQIQTLFDLTPSEARLAASLASGRTLKEAADDRRIQLSTARSYLEKIFQKTRTRQQSQLVAILKSAQSITRRSDH